MFLERSKLRKSGSHLLVFAVAACWSVADRCAADTAAPITLTFDEIPFQSVDGLVHAGVSFDFKIGGVDSTEAFYNSFGPGTLTFVDDPSLTGDSTGVLTLDFVVPTSVVEFGLALNTTDALSPGFRVELFSENLMSLGETPVNVSPTVGALGFSENRFEYLGVAVSRAIIRFDHQPGSFALDNLTFLPVPEPSAFGLGAFGLIAFLQGFRTNRNR